MSELACRFVQFPHPGGEHNPPADDMGWNVDDHRRKFLLTSGRYLDTRGRARTGALVAWGESEPPSPVVLRWPRDGRLPRALHSPYWIEPPDGAPRQNTDPWIWGAQMLYSDCEQIVGPRRLRTSMQDLPIGSVICFGSTIGGQFCVDTVLVIAAAEPWVPAEAASLHVNAAFKTAPEGPSPCRTDAHADLTLYRGATVDRRVHGMYSFVPALPAERGDPRFARPPIRFPELINPASKQSPWGSKRPLSVSTVREAWNEICEQVIDVGLFLAVSLTTPPKRAARSIARTNRMGC
jgi:hypothetical protein